jgi:serine/threonine protein phosphatase PrpC
MGVEQLDIRFGLASERGRRETNDDSVRVAESDSGARTYVAVIADGVSGAGGRLAAEVTVQGFVDGFLSESPILAVDHAAARVLAAMNRWVHAQGRQDPLRRGMATTLTGLILRGRRLHSVHVGDTRAYRLRDGVLTLMTSDHTHDHPDMQHVLIRAVGLEESVRADYDVGDLKPHDRYLLCCDGVHGTLRAARLQRLLAARTAPEETARCIVDTALEAGSTDNVTAMVIDVLRVPAADRLDLEAAVADLPILELPRAGERVDGFLLQEIVSDGRYSRLFHAQDTQTGDIQTGREVIVKFPHPRVVTEAAYRRAFVREAWVASQVRSPFVGEVIELPADRQTRLYSVMPYYAGETLERRLHRAPPVSLDEGVRIGIELSKAVYALNRRDIIHRDVKPENVILPVGGGLRLVDLGVARLSGLEAATDAEIPGTPSYMAPELFDGGAGDAQSDVYALGVTLYRLFSGHYPYGEVEAFSRPRFTRRAPLDHYRADLPAWLDAVLARATALDPAARFGDAMELAFELEHNLAHGPRIIVQRLPLYERNPLRFWQIISLLLLLALIFSLTTR